MAPENVASSAPVLRQPRPQGLRRPLGLIGLVGNAILLLWVVVVVTVIGMSQGPRMAGYRLFIVRSGSMAPAIPTGSAVLVSAVPPQTLRVGDVITFDRGEDGRAPITVTHRIVEIVEPGPPPVFRTQGDANSAPDPGTVTFLGDGGKVVAFLPVAGYALNAVGHPVARLVLVGIPAALLGASFIRDLWRGRT